MQNPSIAQFEARQGLRVELCLGSGRDGEVYSTDHTTAVKFFTIAESFQRERAVYETLKRLGVDTIGGHRVPQFIGADQDLLAIEMSVVSPPFLLDFVSAYLRAKAPEFSAEVWEEWYAEKIEQFGSKWPKVEAVLAEFTRVTGYVLLDVNPGNVRFAPENSGPVKCG